MTVVRFLHSLETTSGGHHLAWPFSPVHNQLCPCYYWHERWCSWNRNSEIYKTDLQTWISFLESLIAPEERQALPHHLLPGHNGSGSNESHAGNASFSPWDSDTGEVNPTLAVQPVCKVLVIEKPRYPDKIISKCFVLILLVRFFYFIFLPAVKAH